MGAWGVTARESDYGLDLLAEAEKNCLAKSEYSVFNVREVMDYLENSIITEIRNTNKGCPDADMDFYIEANFPNDYGQAAVLISECLSDFLRSGKLLLEVYNRETKEFERKEIRKVIFTNEDLKQLSNVFGKIEMQKKVSKSA